MSANDYVEMVREINPKLFAAKDAKLLISSAQLEAVIRTAFESGQVQGKKSKSIFEQVFGPSIFSKP
jgi:hypothetical protein